jgi:hypothetical protein
LWKITQKTLPHFAVGALGGEITNKLTNYVTNGEHDNFGDALFDYTGVDNLTEGTKFEEPIRFIAGMTNPGYYFPYGNMPNYVNDISKSIHNNYYKFKINNNLFPSRLDNLYKTYEDNLIERYSIDRFKDTKINTSGTNDSPTSLIHVDLGSRGNKQIDWYSGATSVPQIKNGIL